MSGQKLLENQILGTWEHEKPKKDPELLLNTNGIADSTVTEISFYLFQKDGVLDIKESYGQFKTNYSITDSTLNLGTRNYKILELSENRMTIEEFGDLVIFKKTLNFKRTETQIQPIPGEEKISEFFKNGKPKVLGLKENGLKNGIWTEWFENGQIKSISYYNNEAPLMTMEFDKNGVLLSKQWYDLNSNSYRTE
ncbi:Hypothetical protein I595_3298 [Croceitalea dokdonensis DOKDO 023]|uniref:Uncharacterized protein n=1 Tax=Croceitalea dokdonensis DOKDO 023 TaxID=1300341 RepID=A0A0P7AP94_9FLAO|nr:hypothetical protein [Croceitalea dokdonensis]KPM30801.1 Hypothetical protein I595_3298 [Croceitalea dokdonensis DOKDO 023]